MIPKIAIVGVTGLVGQMMLRVMEEKKLTAIELIPVASERSVGTSIRFNNKEYAVVSVEQALSAKPDLALFSAGGSFSTQYAHKFTEAQTIVIVNSSVWRTQAEVPLVVPEINASAIRKYHSIIANPNCSTIQLVMTLTPLMQLSPIRRVVVSTYQSVSGSGFKGIQQLESEQQGNTSILTAYPHPIHMNLIPHGGDFDDKGNTAEENKLIIETRKILQSPNLAIAATVVRVPVGGAHSMSVNIEFDQPFSLNEIRQKLENSTGIIVQDDPADNRYPMPIYAQNRDEVFVGRIRRDESVKNGLQLWIVADNLRKGAATNAVQIMEYLLYHGFIQAQNKI